MAKSKYEIHEDGSITFSEQVSEEVRKQAFEEAARQRANATHIDKEQTEQVVELARQSAEATTTVPRETGTEVRK